MLKKENRLSTNFEFNVTRKHGQKLTGSLCRLFYLKPRNQTGITRTGIVVSKKIHKTAVKRNRIKRLFVECLKEKFDTIPNGLWIVIHPNTKCLEAGYEEICSDINTLLSKVSIA